MTTPQAEEYLQARLESCKLLGLDLDDLTPQEAIRADVVTVLRLSLDASQGQLLAGGNADPAKVLALAEALSKAIPERAPKADREDPNYKWWLDPDDPRTKLKEAWRRDVEAARADERENAAQEIERLKALVAERDAEIEDLRAERARPVDARPAALPAESTPPQPVSAAEAERRRLAVNADRSAYTQQGLRPAGSEPWRPFTHLYE
jgi:hypothetical protein